MYAISLTSIPPRFSRLCPVLQSLLAQDPAPAHIYLCLPQRYHRFPGPFTLPELPLGITLLRPETDLGPATKALPAARALAGSGTKLIYCDDDWLMPPYWAARLLTAQHDHEAVTGSGYAVDRLARISRTGAGMADIAQGFSGVLVDPHWLTGSDLTPPAGAWPVDDIWLSGQLARQGIAIRLATGARDGMRLAYEDTHGLQDGNIGGCSRDAANRACVELLHSKYGIWPPAT